MARYPGASWRPLGSQTEPAMARYDIVSLHTMVGSLKGTDSYFKQDGYSGPESHFGVGGKWDSDKDAGLDGVVYQWQDTTHQADANLDGNWRIISIETADNGASDADDIPPWSDKQLAAIVDLVAWVCRTHNIPAVLIPDSKTTRRGIGYHRQGCDPYRVSGGERWSDAYGKVCPTDPRIHQIETIIVPRVQAVLSGKPQEEPSMKTTDQIPLGPANSDTLDQPDGNIQVGEAMVTMAANLVLINEAVAVLNRSMSTAIAHLTTIAANTTPPASGAGG